MPTEICDTSHALLQPDIWHSFADHRHEVVNKKNSNWEQQCTMLGNDVIVAKRLLI